MKKITRKTITDYLHSFCGMEDSEQIFDKETSNDKRYEIINNIFYHFTDHRIDLECRVLMVENDVTAQIRTYYFDYDDFKHIQTLDDLIAELKSAQKVALSIKDFQQQVIQHRSKTNRRFFEIDRDKVISMSDLESER